MKKIWILVNVKKGLIEEPEVFFSLNQAEKKKELLLKQLNKDYDEIGLFEKSLDLTNNRIL